MKKILINLHSKQTIPNYVAIKEISPNEVISFATVEYIDQIKIFEAITNVIHSLKNITAYDFEYNFNVIHGLINNINPNSEIIVNYTGGTKIMAVSLVLKLLLSAKQKLSFVYVNTFDKRLEYLKLSDDNKLTVSNTNITTSVLLDTYVNLKQEKIQSFCDELSDTIVERFKLTESLLLDYFLRGVFNKQKDFFEKKNGTIKPKQKCKVSNNRFELFWNNKQIGVYTNKYKYDYKHCDGGKFFTGGWLEEYVYYKLFKSKYYDQTLSNVKFDFTSFEITNNNNRGEVFKNEIDVVVTKGLKTVFIECKAGKVTQDYVYKLQTIRDYFLGTFGEAILVTKFKQSKNIIEKCDDANITIVSEENISDIHEIVKAIID